MGVRVLGPLEVGEPDLPVRVPGTMRRRLLAVLTTSPGVELSTDQLVDALWGDAATASSLGTLHSHVTRLRHDLPDDIVITTGPRGYRLDVPLDAIDAARFADSAARGAAELAAGRPAEASAVLSGALSLWRGPAYAEFVGVAVLDAEAARLEALRVDASEQLLAAELARGEAPVAGLEAFVAAYPTREGAWALLVQALYRSGRQADALAAFRRARDHLHDELGIEPGRELRELEQRVLAQDPQLDRPMPAAQPQPQRPGAGERRPVSVVTVAQRGGRRDDALRDLVVDLAALHGGTARVGVDGELVVLLGWPAAHEDDPERAVRLALALRDSPLGSGRRLAVGVATGRAEGAHGDEAPLGRPLVAAAGLAHRCLDGDVLLDTATVRRVGHAVEVEALPDGAARLLSLTSDGPSPRTLSGTPFVGRARDLATLRAAYDQAVGDRRAHLVTVVADAGMGKSRLVHEFAESVGAGAAWCGAHCRPYGERVAYAPLLDLVRRHAGIDDRDDASTVRAKLAAVVGPDDADLVVDRLGPLLGGPTDLAPSKVEAQRALRAVLQSVARSGPAVIHVEDLHWGAGPLLDVLEDLVADPEPVPLLVVATARPELFVLRPDWGAGRTPGTTLVLAPLDVHDCRSLLTHLELDRSRADEIALRCGGNPFFAEELARTSSLGPGTGTPALEALVEARLDALTDDERAALLAASVVGRRVRPSQVADLLDRDRDGMRGVLDSLVRKQFLRRGPGSGRRDDAELAFVHDLVEHAAYARLLPDDRARHHLMVAGFWRGTDDRGLAAYADLVAHHELSAYDAALDGRDVALAEAARGRAVQSALEAGQRVQGLDTATALGLLTRAAELTEPGTPLQAVVQLRLAGVVFDGGDYQRAIDLLRESLTVVEGRDEALVVDALLYWISALFALGGSFDEAESTLERALGRATPSRPMVRLLALKAMLRLFDQTTSSMREVLALTQRAIAIDAETRCGGVGFAHVLHGRARVALGDGDGLAELEAWLSDVERHEFATLSLGAWQWWAGAVHHWTGSAAELKARERLSYLAESRGLAFLYSMGVSEHARVLWEVGRLRECVELADTVVLGQEDAMLRWSVVQRALALADLGELDPGTVEAVRGTPPADPGDLRHVAGATAVVAHALLERGDRAGARAELERLDLAACADRDGAMELLPRLVRLAHEAGCAEQVRRLEGIDETPTPLRRIVAVHVRGLQRWSSGEHDEARRLLAEAADAWAGFGTVSEERAARAVLVQLPG